MQQVPSFLTGIDSLLLDDIKSDIHHCWRERHRLVSWFILDVIVVVIVRVYRNDVVLDNLHFLGWCGMCKAASDCWLDSRSSSVLGTTLNGNDRVCRLG